ncbi:MAG: stage V sporulation protein AB [Bacteroidales bacterium]|nr:stage V sporulation protein AB [Bacteroidales bacterium]MCM1416260.1 stage V sporulation protein AB [bacterium]MCM1422384.1 stage V sporulation protein AB [bacterium]
MTFLRQALLAVIGVSAGLIVSAGVFTVLISVGLVPRFAGKTHVAKKVFVLEEMVVFGTLTGSYFSIFGDWGQIGAFVKDRALFGAATDGIWNLIGTVILIVFGLFAGIFVGCLALAIAEMLNTIPVFARRIGFRHGLGAAILSVALGKLCGSLIYFTQKVFLYGG